MKDIEASECAAARQKITHIDYEKRDNKYAETIPKWIAFESAAEVEKYRKRLRSSLLTNADKDLNIALTLVLLAEIDFLGKEWAQLK